MYSSNPDYKIRFTDQVFTHRDPDTNKQRTWGIGVIERILLDKFNAGQIELLQIPIDPEFVKVCEKERGLEERRVLRMVPEVLDIPIFFLKMEDETHLLLDGTHRYVYAHRLGRKMIKCVIVPQDVADFAEVKGFPPISDWDAYLNSPSFIR